MRNSTKSPTSRTRLTPAGEVAAIRDRLLSAEQQEQQQPQEQPLEPVAAHAEQSAAEHVFLRALRPIPVEPARGSYGWVVEGRHFSNLRFARAFADRLSETYGRNVVVQLARPGFGELPNGKRPMCGTPVNAGGAR